jgi:hypothetical protein
MHKSYCFRSCSKDNLQCHAISVSEVLVTCHMKNNLELASLNLWRDKRFLPTPYAEIPESSQLPCKSKIVKMADMRL